METRAAKRQRIASEASTQSIVELLPVEVLRDIFSNFVGPGHYRYVAGTCRAFRDAYESATPDQNGNKTTWESAAASVSCAELCLKEAVSIDHIAWEREARNMYQIGLAIGRWGQVGILEWYCKQDHGWNRNLFREAGRCGRLEVFEWAVANGFHWDYSGTIDCVAGAGHVEVLDFLLKHTLSPRYASQFCAPCAAKGGHVSALECMKRLGLLTEHVNECWRSAAENGHVHVLDWLLDNEYSLQPQVMSWAAKSGQISVFQWALEHQVEWSVETCAEAALHGHLDALKWLRSNGCPWDGNVIHLAVKEGHLDVVEWARSNGCSEAERIYSYLAFF